MCYYDLTGKTYELSSTALADNFQEHEAQPAQQILQDQGEVALCMAVYVRPKGKKQQTLIISLMSRNTTLRVSI